MTLKTTLPYMLLLALAPWPLAAAEPLLADRIDATGTASAPEIPALSSLVAEVLRHQDRRSRSRLRECLSELEPPDNRAHALFTAAPLSRLPDGRMTYYLRPSPSTRCQVFYGAHVFHYWIVAARTKGPATLLHSGLVDRVTIHSATTNGRPDVEETQCTPVGCQTTTLRHDGRRYRPRVCTQFQIGSDGKEITEAIPCADD